MTKASITSRLSSRQHHSVSADLEQFYQDTLLTAQKRSSTDPARNHFPLFLQQTTADI
jgi:hypothetical protein